MAASSALLARWRRTKTELVSGHRCSAGCNAGKRARRVPEEHVLGHTQADAGMPAGAVEHEDDLLGGAGSDGTREGGELDCKHGTADGRRQMGQMADGPSAGRVDKAD